MPFISCVMVTTRQRTWILPEAVQCFLNQEYTNCELVIGLPAAHEDQVKQAIPSDPRIRIQALPRIPTIGGCRNATVGRTRGDWLTLWDDDDWSAPSRLTRLVEAIQQDPSIEIAGPTTMRVHELRTSKNWTYTYQGATPYVIGSGLSIKKRFWEGHPFPTHTGVGERHTGSDTALIVPALAQGTRYAVTNFPYVYLIHGQNVSTPEIPRYFNDPYYEKLPDGSIEIDQLTSGWLSRVRQRKLNAGN